MSTHSRPRPAGLPHNSAHKAGGELDATNPLAKSEELSPGRLTFAGLRTITVGVISGLRQKLSQLAVRSGGSGDGLLERARNASFILLGLTAAIGLGLIAFIAHLGWPNITDGPIPGLPSEHIAVKSAAITAAAPFPRQGAGSGAQTLLGAAPLLPRARVVLVTRPLQNGSAHPRISGSKSLPVPSRRGKGGGPPSGQGAVPSPSTPPTTSTNPSPAPTTFAPPDKVTATAHSTSGDGGDRGGSGAGFGSSRGSNDGQGFHGSIVAHSSPHQGSSGSDATVSGTPNEAAGSGCGDSHGHDGGPAAQYGGAGSGYGYGAGHGYANGPAAQHGEEGPGFSHGHGSSHFGG